MFLDRKGIFPVGFSLGVLMDHTKWANPSEPGVLMDHTKWANPGGPGVLMNHTGWANLGHSRGSHEPYHVDEPEHSHGRPRGWTRIFPGPTASGSVRNVFRMPIWLDSRVYFNPPILLPGSLKNHCAGGSVQNLGELVL